MMQKLPCGGFLWNKESWDKERIMNLSNEGEIGYFFEVDLKIPKELHDKFNDYPLAPTHEKGVYSESMKAKMGKEKEEKTNKLLATLNDKERYVLHYRNLKLYMQLGYELGEIHQVLEFKQDYIMKEYIEMNTKLRMQAKKDGNDFLVNLYKLMNNAIFGKTCENIRNHKDIKLEMNDKKQKKLLSSPLYHSKRIFDNDVMGIELFKNEVKYNSPVAIGVSILDLSKELMYDFYYNSFKKYFENSEVETNLFFTDTDSLAIEFVNKKKDTFLYDEVSQFLMETSTTWMDLSNYPKNHPLHNPINAQVPGKFKIETGINLIDEFIGLRSKLYAYSAVKIEYVDGMMKNVDKCKEAKKCKGITKSVIDKNLTLELYKKSNFELYEHSVDQIGFKVDHHIIRTVKTRKIALSPYDNKRLVESDMIGTKALGYGGES
jgi:hypothetical protein